MKPATPTGRVRTASDGAFELEYLSELGRLFWAVPHERQRAAPKRSPYE
jgi:hypothetical protein